MGTLGRGLGYDHVVWGTDAVWTGYVAPKNG
jgi:hypothetical protein